MSYEITITKTETQRIWCGGEWTTIEERPLTEKEAANTFTTGRSQLKTIYGYTPKIVKYEPVTNEIYKQTIPEIDLPAVIRAVNMMD